MTVGRTSAQSRYDLFVALLGFGIPVSFVVVGIVIALRVSIIIDIIVTILAAAQISVSVLRLASLGRGTSGGGARGGIARLLLPPLLVLVRVRATVRCGATTLIECVGAADARKQGLVLHAINRTKFPERAGMLRRGARAAAALTARLAVCSGGEATPVPRVIPVAALASTATAFHGLVNRDLSAGVGVHHEEFVRVVVLHNFDRRERGRLLSGGGLVAHCEREPRKPGVAVIYRSQRRARSGGIAIECGRVCRPAAVKRARR